MEIVYTPKGYRGFKSLLLRQQNSGFCLQNRQNPELFLYLCRFTEKYSGKEGHYVGKIHFHTGDRPFRDGFVFHVVSVQKQPDAVPRPVCFLSVLHSTFADAGRDHRGNQLCAEHGSFLLPGKQEQLSERENHVRRAVRHAGGGADFHLGRLVVDSAGSREYCGHGRRVYVQSAENPSRWDACQFAAVDHL